MSEIFGDFDPFLIAEVFQSTLFAAETQEISEEEDICKHPTIKVDDTDKTASYCVICGEVFDNHYQPTSKQSKCEHINVTKDESGLDICSKCGKEMVSFDFSQEWRNFGSWDNRVGGDQSRCHTRALKHNSIKDIFDSHFIPVSSALAEMVEAKFNKVIDIHQNKVVRCETRTAIVAICLFHCYQDVGENRTAKEMRKMFDVTQKKMSQAMKLYYAAFPEDAAKEMKPEDLIPRIMKLMSVGHEHHRNIVAISKYFSATSSTIERSCPQSIAASTIYFYLCLYPQYKKELGLTITICAKKAKLSSMTITKIVRIMAEIAMIAVEEWNNENTPQDIKKPRKSNKKHTKVMVH